VHTTWCDIGKASREFGYRAPTQLEDGLRQTWGWFLANQAQWKDIAAVSSSD
jgi:dTDP-D-glucose 4,6-dehydratase